MIFKCKSHGLQHMSHGHMIMSTYPGISPVSALEEAKSATLAIMDDFPEPGPPSNMRGASTPMPIT